VRHVAAMGRHTEGLPENMRKMISAEVYESCELAERNFLRKMCFDKFGDRLPLSGRQPTANRRLVQAAALSDQAVSSIGKRIIAVGAATR
jgi:hypothetical protein